MNFRWIKYLGKGLSYLENWGIGVNYGWNYGPSKLLLHFIEYCLDQLNSQHTKIVVNSIMQYFEGHSQNLTFFGPPTTKWKLFAKLNGNHFLMVNIFKIHEYQTIGLMKMHNISKIWFVNIKFSLYKSLVYD